MKRLARIYIIAVTATESVPHYCSLRRHQNRYGVSQHSGELGFDAFDTDLLTKVLWLIVLSRERSCTSSNSLEFCFGWIFWHPRILDLASGNRIS
jgi:hypothetical protein